MTCSTRCSSSGGLPALAAACILALGCGHRGAARAQSADPAPPPGVATARTAPAPAAAAGPLRVVVLPLENAAGVAVPTKELAAVIERRMATRFDLVTGAPLEEFLSRHRLRYTGGLDAETARAGRDELGVDAFLITSLEVYRAAEPPTVGLTMRLVAAGEEPVILWMEHAVRGGEDRPGLLRLGVLQRLGQVRDDVLAQLLASLDRHLRGKADRGAACSPGLTYRPKIRFRSTLLDDGHEHTVAVVPFLNRSKRRSAGELVALEFVRQLTRTGRYRVLEPGVVRDYMLRSRIMIPGGVSLETTRLFLGALGVDIVVSGEVFEYAETYTSQGPTIRFSATMLDGGSGEMIWHSTSYNRGDDGVYFFGLGRVRNAGDLSCRMVSGVVAKMGERHASDMPPRRDGVGLDVGSR